MEPEDYNDNIYCDMRDYFNIKKNREEYDVEKIKAIAEQLLKIKTRNISDDTYLSTETESETLTSEEKEKLIKLRNILKKHAGNPDISNEDFGKFVRNCLEAMK
jgi:hypothetical protein